ncbi:prepilin-type N-terminal cleavage/methylation domain-containing protein [Persephonella sp. KM09-Lau-8]|uniref:prepilin-type N-terminal cleavage/methylation domain-containing protein n=1 Tax=Persephonella sp. KM09-Lau-8 TaxID=1158345 RepID=UPI00068A847E|nr:prepilin-type N-terminal cleavage/methylation domain-containing protein [Persephonella sp. KM09-Lau-8]
MKRTSQKGFTLVELAIVLVIIGIILGAVLKGQELINNAKAKRVQNDMRGLEAVVWTFYDRYGRFPGDCNSDGVIDAITNNGTGGLDNNPAKGLCSGVAYDGDRDRPWAELRAAYLVNDIDNRKLSLTALGGRFFIGRAYAGSGTQFRSAIAVADIPCFAAKMIDVSIDGEADAGVGRVRELTGAYTARNASDPNWGTTCTDEHNTVDLVFFFDKLP